MNPSQPLSATEAAASAWFLRRREGALDAFAERDFQAWLAESPLNRQEYERLDQVWDDMAALPRPAPRVAAQAPAPRPRLAAYLKWGCVAAALALTVAAAYQYLPVSYTTLANSATQTRSVDLPDGTQVHANGGTRVTVKYTLAERRINIEGGEVFIDAAADRRPLIVEAGGAQLRDIGTEFNVLLLPDTLQVGVRSGVVLLDSGDAQAPVVRRLQAGDTVRLARGPGRQVREQRVPLTEIGAWQDGVVVVHDMTVQQLAAYMALHREAPVLVADARAGGLRLSGTLDLRQPEAFLDVLPSLLPVTLNRRPDGTAVVASR
ncbi:MULTISPECIES: FecR domain-containing protein [Achromobacter]|uniref:FecR family protein n=1 Tax=Achromobacter TaxID=222 RepID=UPI0025B9158D|nr:MULTISPECIES: FecR domain-containing protein [Achromobacter]